MGPLWPLCSLPVPLQGRGARRAVQAAGGLAERHEFSGLLLCVLVSPPVLSGDVSLAPSQAHSPERGAPLLLFLSPLSLNQNQSVHSVPLPQVPKAGHCAELSGSETGRCQPGAGCCFFRWYFGLPVPTPLQLSDGARGPVGLLSSSLQLLHSLPFSKVCNFQQLLLRISVSHWRRSFLYCKETYLRLLRAVRFGVSPQTPPCSGAPSSGGRGRCCHPSSGQRCMS